MNDEVRARFDTLADAWAGYNQQPLGHIRSEVTWRNLLPHLPPIADPAEPPRILDAGGGSGELVLRLVGRGYRAWLLEYVSGMLDQARHAARDLPAEARARLNYCLLPAEEAGTAFAPGFFQAITCHTLIEYVPRPQDTLRALAHLLEDGGMLSLSFVNCHAEVLRQVWQHGDPAGALTGLQGKAFCAHLFDVMGQAYTAEQATGWLADLGLVITATYGVRAFADQVPTERLHDAEFFAALLELEAAASCRLPYRHIARYVHLIACKKQC